MFVEVGLGVASAVFDPVSAAGFGVGWGAVLGAACAVAFGAAGLGADAFGAECVAGLVVLAVRLGGALAELDAELQLRYHSKANGRADDRDVEYDREELREGP